MINMWHSHSHHALRGIHLRIHMLPYSFLTQQHSHLPTDQLAGMWSRALL